MYERGSKIIINPFLELWFGNTFLSSALKDTVIDVSLFSDEEYVKDIKGKIHIIRHNHNRDHIHINYISELTKGETGYRNYVWFTEDEILPAFFKKKLIKYEKK